MIDRFARQLVAAGGLALLGLSAALGAVGNVFALAVFRLLIGASTSILGPSIGAAAADRFKSAAAAGRAATLVSATTSMMAIGAAAGVLGFYFAPTCTAHPVHRSLVTRGVGIHRSVVTSRPGIPG